jgi:protein deglycase
MKKVLLLLADGFETFEASVFIDVIGWNLVEGDHSTELFTCGLRKEIKSSFKQSFIVDHLIGDIDIDSYDALAIPGGFEVYGFYQDAYDLQFLDLIRRFRDKHKFIASICVGALPLGKSGVLKGKKGTTYHSAVRREALQGFGVQVLNQAIVIDDDMVTSWNPSTAVDVAFILLEHLTSKLNAEKVCQLMGFDGINVGEGLLNDYKDAEKHNWTKEELEECEYAQMREQDKKGEIELAEERAAQHERIEIAKKLISLNIDKKTVQESTGLAIEMIEKLIRERTK